MDEQKREQSLWFRPWKWPRRIWVAVLPLALAGYLLSAAPVIYTIYRCGLEKDRIIVNTVRAVYFPIDLLDSYSDTYHRLFRWQMATIVQLFGDSDE